MIGWVSRLFGRTEAPAPSLDAPLPEPTRNPRTEAEVAAVETALAGLIAAGIRLGAHYETLSLREAARRMAEHPEFAAGYGSDDDLTVRASDTISIDILWSYRSLEDEIEDEFTNAALFADHCYDGAGTEAYAGLFRRFVTLADAWNCRGVTASPLPDRGPYGHGFHIAFDAEPPISPVTFPADKNFDWRLLNHLNASLPPSEPRRLRVVADGGTALVLFLTEAEARGVESCLGFGRGTIEIPA